MAEDDLTSQISGIFAPKKEAPSLYRDRPAPGTVTTVTPDWAKQGYDPFSQKQIPQKELPLSEQVSSALAGKKETPIKEQPLAYRAGERMAETSSPAVQQALSGLSGYTDTLTMGWAPWLEAAGVKGLSYIDPRESTRAYREKIQEMPIRDIVEMARGMQSKSQEAYPKTALAGEAAGVAGGALALPTVGPASMPFTSGALTGSLYGYLGGLSKDLDPIQSAKESLMGGALGGTLSKIAEPVVSRISRAFTPKEQILSEYGYLMPDALKAARDAGLSQDEINRMIPNLASAFEKYGIGPEAVRMAQFERFGVEPTKGMITREPSQVALETKNVAPGVGPYATPSYERIGEQAAETAERLTGGAPIPNVRGSVGQAVSKIQSEAEKAEQAYQQAYKIASEQPGGFKRDYLVNVGDKIERKLNADPEMSGITSLPVVRNTLNELNDAIGSFKPTIDEATGAPLQIMHRGFQTVERARQNLNVAYGNATPAEKTAIREVINRFDDHFENAINEGAFSGDPAVVQQWKDARAAYKSYMDRFGIKKTGGDAKSLIKTIVEGDMTPAKVADMMFNFAQSGDASMASAAGDTIRQMERALGPNSPEIKQIKDSFLRQLMTPRGGTQKDFATTAKDITNFLEGKGGGVAQEMFGKEQLDLLRDFSKIMQQSATQKVAPSVQQMSRIKYVLKKAPMEVVENFLLPMAYAHPVAGAILAGIKSVIDLGGAYKTAPEYLSKLANEPFARPAPSRVVPGIRPMAPLAITELSRQQDLERRGRKSGGRAVDDSAKSKADKLIAMVDRVRKSEGKDTSSLLNLDDTTIAKALAVANRGI
jgi:hypothetical protein